MREWVVTGEAARTLARRWLEGETVQQLAREYGLPPPAVERALREVLTVTESRGI